MASVQRTPKAVPRLKIKGGLPPPKPEYVRRANQLRAKSLSSTPAPQQPRPSKLDQEKQSCPNPECEDPDVQEDDGKVLCHNCGTILSESDIAAEVTFLETSNGAAQIQGQHVAAGQETARGQAGMNRILQTQDSTSATRAAGERAIKEMGGSMNIPRDDIDRAIRIYGLVFNSGGTKGREKMHVAAVCLYIGTRMTENSSVMLIDFADRCNVNVFYLGRMFTEFIRETNIRVETIKEVTPEGLVDRFCQDLKFGPDEWRIRNEAVRILQRMKRDWIVTGRRPSGLCGAAVILAARMNNYRRTVREVVYTAKVCELTISKRLHEFNYTAASKLSVKEFRERALDLEENCDPPAFYQPKLPKKSKKRKRTIADEVEREEVQTISSDSESSASESDLAEATGEENERVSAKRSKKGQDAQQSEPPIDPALLAASSQAYADLHQSSSTSASSHAKAEKRSHDKTTSNDEKADVESPHPETLQKRVLIQTPEGIADDQALEDEITARTEDPEMLSHVEEVHKAAASENFIPDPDRTRTEVIPDDPEQAPEVDVEDVLGPEEENDPDAQNHDDLKPIMQVNSDGKLVPKAYFPTTKSLTDKHPDTERIPEDEFAGDPEVENCILTEAEREVKEHLWITKYGKHLRERHLKRVSRLIDEENGTIKTRGKRSKPRMGDMSQYGEPDKSGRRFQSRTEAITAMLQKRAMSTKVNYDKISKVYDDRHSAKPSSPGGNEQTGSRDESEAPSEAANGDGFFLSATPRKRVQPTTRAGREALKKENEARRAARAAEKLEKEKQRQQNKGDDAVRRNMQAMEQAARAEQAARSVSRGVDDDDDDGDDDDEAVGDERTPREFTQWELDQMALGLAGAGGEDTWDAEGDDDVESEGEVD